jgi:hypothetical protein
VLAFTNVPAVIVRSSSVDIVIGGTCIALAVALNGRAGRHCDGPAPGIVRRAKVVLPMPLVSIGCARVNNKK